MTDQPSYFFVAVSTAENLELCREYGLAGFPGSQSGDWAFADIEAGDYLTFVYGATAHDLYRVEAKHALLNADTAGPWPELELRDYGTYHFPFRLELEQERRFEESLVRREFRYIGENLLLRGGYRRSHFQADRTTLQQVSAMGERTQSKTSPPDWSRETTSPRWVRQRGGFEPPKINKFREDLLHVLLRRRFSADGGMTEFVDLTGIDPFGEGDVEILGERALPEGHLDILLKDANPVGTETKVPVEVKLNRAGADTLEQLRGYMDQLQPECPGGVIVGSTIGRDLEPPSDVAVVRWAADPPIDEPRTLSELESALTLRSEHRADGHVA